MSLQAGSKVLMGRNIMAEDFKTCLWQVAVPKKAET